MFSLLKLTFSLLLCPRSFPLTLQPNIERSPTGVPLYFFLQREHLTASANYLVPVIFGAGLLKQ